VVLFTFGQGDLAFDEVAFPIELGGYAGVSFLVSRGVDFC